MPLSPSGVEHQRRLLPVGIKPTDEVMVLRFTGEVFKDYECASDPPSAAQLPPADLTLPSVASSVLAG